MQLRSTAELTDLFAEYYQADVDDSDYLFNAESFNGDVDLDHAALTSANAAAAVPANTRAILGDNTEECNLVDMISADESLAFGICSVRFLALVHCGDLSAGTLPTPSTAYMASLYWTFSLTSKSCFI